MRKGKAKKFFYSWFKVLKIKCSKISLSRSNWNCITTFQIPSIQDIEGKMLNK